MIMVVDMPYLAHMAEYTVGDSLSHKGKPTGILYGSLSMLLGLIRQFRPTVVVLAWDSRASLRKEMCPTYKANRKPLNDKDKLKRKAFHYQVRILRKALKRMGLLTVLRKGYEGDDVIAEVCVSALDDVLIVAGDHDLFQLIRPGVRMWIPNRRIMATVKWFTEKTGLLPTQWARVKAIGGCSSDNVKGIPRVAETTAINYLLKKTTEKQNQAIAAGKDIIKQNMRLVALPFEGMRPVTLRRNRFNEKAYETICKQYGIRGMSSLEWKSALNGRKFP